MPHADVHLAPPPLPARKPVSARRVLVIVASILLVCGTGVVALAAVVGAFSKVVEAGKPEMPVAVTYRKAAFGPGLVLQLRNNSDRTLTVVLEHHNPTLSTRVRNSVDLGPHAIVELGWAENFKFASGDEVKLDHAEYQALHVRLP